MSYVSVSFHIILLGRVEHESHEVSNVHACRGAAIAARGRVPGRTDDLLGHQRHDGRQRQRRRQFRHQRLLVRQRRRHHRHRHVHQLVVYRRRASRRGFLGRNRWRRQFDHRLRVFPQRAQHQGRGRQHHHERRQRTGRLQRRRLERSDRQLVDFQPKRLDQKRLHLVVFLRHKQRRRGDHK